MATRDEILRMAREAGFVVSDLGVGFPMGEGLTIADLCENLVRLAQAAAYERAAQKMEQFDYMDPFVKTVACDLACGVRALKEQL